MATVQLSRTRPLEVAQLPGHPGGLGTVCSKKDRTLRTVNNLKLLRRRIFFKNKTLTRAARQGFRPPSGVEDGDHRQSVEARVERPVIGHRAYLMSWSRFCDSSVNLFSAFGCPDNGREEL